MGARRRTDFADLIVLRARNAEYSAVTERARIIAKGRMTVPKRIRDAASPVTGDVVVLEIENGRVTMRKPPAGEDRAI